MFKFDRTSTSRQLNLEIIFISQNLSIREDNLSPYQCLLKSTYCFTVFLIWELCFYIEIKCTKYPLLKRKFVHFSVENTLLIEIKEMYKVAPILG